MANPNPNPDPDPDPDPDPNPNPNQKLALDAYYTWLADLGEQMDRKSLEQAAANP